MHTGRITIHCAIHTYILEGSLYAVQYIYTGGITIHCAIHIQEVYVVQYTEL